MPSLFEAEIHFAKPQGSFVIERDLIYRDSSTYSYSFDLYYPQKEDAVPVVLLIHGEGPPEILRNAKDWGQYRSWGRLLASSGIAAVAFNRRSSEGFSKMEDSASDVRRMLKHVEAVGDSLLDETRIGIFALSAGVPLGASLALREPDRFAALVCYYGPLSHRGFMGVSPQVSDKVLRRWSPLNILGTSLPKTLIVQAGLDRPELNESIQEFVQKARIRGLPIESAIHETGHHAFDIRDDQPRTQEIIAMTVRFLKKCLLKGNSDDPR